jgi:hypothetical protein
MRLPVEPATCTVLGHKPKGTDDPLWAGLDLTRAELREWTYDPHLGVPWLHPDDQKRYDHPDFWAIYRVRPRMEQGKRWKNKMVKAVNFVRDADAWWIDVEFVSHFPTEE